MTKVIETNIDQLVPDNKNMNKHSEYGMHLLENSLRKFGAGRSILLDKNNRVIAGNGVLETASSIDLNNVIIVETDGKQLVAVKRKDIDLDSAQGRELALADNATAKANITWDEEAVIEVAQSYEIDVEDWGVPDFADVDLGDQDDEPKKEISSRLIVECGDVTKLSLLFSELQDRGFKCDLKE